MSELVVRGASGRGHRFTIHRPGDAHRPAPAVYAFARPGAGGRGWTVVFLSRTANLEARLANHERWEEARRLGATHILIHQREERDAREFVEADLLAALRPALNMDGPPTPTAPLAEPAPAPLRERAQLRLVWAA